MSTRVKLGFVTFLTVVRFPLVLLFFAAAVVYEVFSPSAWIFVFAFVSLIASAVTDLFDGYFARRFQVETQFGAHADPLMDKFFYLATFPLLVFVSSAGGSRTHAVVLLVLTALFLMRDQWVTFLRSIGSIYNVPGNANWSGKLRTSITFPLICCIYFYVESPRPFIPGWFVYAFEAFAFIINVISLFVYTRTYWPYLRRATEMEEKADRPT